MKLAITFALVIASSAAVSVTSAARPVARGNSVQSCGAWAVRYGGSPNACPEGYSYTAGDDDTCTNNANCAKNCCSPDVPQSCGSWSVKNGGPINSCGSGYKYSASDSDECAASGTYCKQRCCTKSKKKQPVVYRRGEASNAAAVANNNEAVRRSSGQKCGNWAVKNGGGANACGDSYTYTAGSNTRCAANGSNCLDICCTPVDSQLCGEWSVSMGGPNNACPSSTTYTATDEQVCAADGDGCAEICCSSSDPVVYRRAA